MSVAIEAGLADGDGGVSPKHKMTPRPLRSSRVSPPPVTPAATTTPAVPAGTATHEDSEEAAQSHEASAPEPFPPMTSPNMSRNRLNSFSLRTDPDAQATVTDFLDFTEYLPSDMTRSLTLIGKLDDAYIDASTNVHKLTELWGQLPNTPAGTRPSATKLRADISDNLNQGISARVYAHAEALRMAENVNRHYFRAKTILAKLRTMLENYPEAEQQQQAQLQQKQQQQQQQREQEQRQLQNQQSKPKKSNGQQRMRRQRVPRITVPGEVLAPYDLDYESYSGESDISSPSSDDESPPPTTMRRKSTPAAQSRLKGLKGTGAGGVGVGHGGSSSSFYPPKIPKVRVPRESRVPGQPYISTSSALARLKPPPENAVIGSADAPWLRLTAYELAKLRKRMKKNAQWSPSETMIARELKALGRNLDAFNQARKRAEAEGRVFEGVIPESPLELSASSADAALAGEDNQVEGQGIKLNDTKKSKNDLGQLAAREAEESTRRMMEAARAIFSPYPSATPDAAAAGSGSLSARATTPAVTSATTRKRKREGPVDVADTVEGVDAGASEAATPLPTSQRQLQKRIKTETPVPIPQHTAGSAPPHDASNNNLATPAPQRARLSMTPVHAPVLGQGNGGGAAASQDASANAPQSRQSTTMSSPLSSGASSQSVAGYGTTTTTTVPLKPPAETPIHPPMHKSTTPIHPPVRELRTREPMRKDLPLHQQHNGTVAGEDASEDLAVPLRASRSSSRALTPNTVNPTNALGIMGTVLPTTEGPAAGAMLTTAGPSTTMTRRASRGVSAAPPNVGANADGPGPSLAAERPRRASTAHNTPVPDGFRQTGGTSGGKRVKRPAPGVVSRTSSGGSAAVGQRKAAPRKKRGSNAHQQRRDSRGKSTDGDEVEVDDDGNVIDANEPRYCVCNRVSFGTMIQCDNVDNCKQEWFHLECVGLTAVPARTTKWYCPDCRVLLNIGEKGEVSARGVKM
ncbi:hypothetical protein SPBR_02290 [Sporothrix brasiliensis 5110]|uniref:PHD-type domain-containing protein n=1 Tax=Sporothrix brasiliensis 5110 TaxID=1398154 RepID=A0A0C2J5A5_9PEZI|nr:uncharacterized protein SPBR_02290 [Sporothrix brasiliensis 5110]KIH92217.1 hypothetical protein SPBR_02290 [Sporothrix brasiliensis 5110]